MSFVLKHTNKKSVSDKLKLGTTTSNSKHSRLDELFTYLFISKSSFYKFNSVRPIKKKLSDM